jgi:uncharacterized protein (TIGR00725 family)
MTAATATDVTDAVTGAPRHRAVQGRTAVFYGGVVPASVEEERLAFEVGRSLGRAGFRLRHGGYNGLMEAAAAGAAEFGADIVAVTLDGKDWGPFNRYVTHVIAAPDMGTRITTYLTGADLVVGMGGGVGTLHELTAAIWYAGNIHPLPVWIVGPTALRLLAFVRGEGWLFETPTRPLGFLGGIGDPVAFDDALARLVGDSTLRWWRQ